MSRRFDVYEHPLKGAWGVAVEGQSITVAAIQNGELSQSTLKPIALAGEISKRVRGGFKKLPRAKYLATDLLASSGLLGWCFTETHPDLAMFGGSVLFTPKSHSDDLEQLTAQWCETLRKTSLSEADLQAWVDCLKRAESYLAAPRLHPAFALVLADWAICNQRFLSSEHENMPTRRPCELPTAWSEWLNKSFTTGTPVQSVLEQLEWSLKDVLLKSTSTHPQLNSEDGWTADTSAFAF